MASQSCNPSAPPPRSSRHVWRKIDVSGWALATVDGFSTDETKAFLKRVIDEELPQVVAVVDENVIGWCDIIPKSAKGTSHVGTLGMGVLKEWRNQGIGRRLLGECLELARSAGWRKSN